MLGPMTALSILGIMLTSCTTKPESSTLSAQTPESVKGASSLENIGALPVCSEKSDGQLVYLRESKTFKICSGKAWLDKENIPNKTIADVRKIEANDSSCPEAGTLVLSGEDKNKNDRLDKDEISNEEKLCQVEFTEAKAKVLGEVYQAGIFRVKIDCISDIDSRGAIHEIVIQSSYTTAWLCEKETLCSNRLALQVCDQEKAVDSINRSFRLASLEIFNTSSGEDSEAPLYSGVPEILFHPNSSIDAAKIKIRNFASNVTVLPLARSDDRLATLASALSLGFSSSPNELASCTGPILNSDFYPSRDLGGAGFSVGRLCAVSSSDGSPSIDVQTGRVIGVKTRGEGSSTTLDWQIPARRYLEF